MTLKDLREEIDEIDREILALIGRRLAIARQIAGLKKKQGLPTLDAAREIEIQQTVKKIALDHHLSPAVMQELFQMLLDYTRLEMDRELS